MVSRLRSVAARNSWYSATWASFSLNWDFSSAGVHTMPALSICDS